MDNKLLLKKWEIELEKLKFLTSKVNSSTSAYAVLSSKYQQLYKCIFELKEAENNN